MVVRDEIDIREHDSAEKKSNWKKKIFMIFWPRGAHPGAQGGSHISAPDSKFKNRLGAPKRNQMRGLLPKNEPNRPRRLGCRGGGQ